MSYKLKRVMSMMIAMFVAFSMMVVGTGEVNAASGKMVVYIGSHAEGELYVGESGYVGAYNAKTLKEGKIKSVTVSNKTVAKVHKETYSADGKKYTNTYVVGKKPGKTKVTIKYKYNGNVKTKKLNVEIKAYPNAIKGVVINGKTKKITADRKFYFSQKYKKTSAKVKVIPADGWKITNVFGNTNYWKGDQYKSANIKGAKAKVKKGSKIKFAKKYEMLSLYVTLEKGGEKFDYNIDLWR